MNYCKGFSGEIIQIINTSYTDPTQIMSVKLTHVIQLNSSTTQVSHIIKQAMNADRLYCICNTYYSNKVVAYIDMKKLVVAVLYWNVKNVTCSRQSL